MTKYLNKKSLLMGGGVFIFTVLVIISYLLFTDDYTDAKFRTMKDEFTSVEKLDLTGLRELQASGGPIVDFPDLKKRLEQLNKTIIIIDGMRENHGYINDMATTFFGYHRKKPGLRYYIRRILFTGTTRILPQRTLTEIELAQKYGFGYKNIKIDSKIKTPDASVDEFVSYFDKIPENVWFHFHCRHGKGRTSMMLVMYDIMKNAPKVALSDIIKRQHLLGSVDLFDTVVWKTKKKGRYNSRTLNRRKQFMEQFYEFVCQRKAGGIQRWSDWHRLSRKGNIS
ncbi:MAG: hypothetical protein BGO67_12885 [Alphaproteobacteria bacterium 41-28]|nr:MAG: hypothetical protein BGO67_12885 [Alphaproteobacteria bacterium 41-28]